MQEVPSTITAATGVNIKRAARLLAAGKVVVIPTETVYGLAANALDEQAVTQIFTVKNRPHFNPLIIHIGSSSELNKYVTEVPPLAQMLIEKFWPGPLTLLLPKKDVVPDMVTASLSHVAVRVPDHPLTLQLLQLLDFPLAAPSANPFCYISPTNVLHVQQQIGDKIPYILDGGPCKSGVESTIVGFKNGQPVIYRLGAITPEELEAVTGVAALRPEPQNRPASPGMLPYHYAPRTPLYFTDNIEELLEGANPAETGIITFHKRVTGIPEEHTAVLSPTADMQEAAHHLYHALHRLDGLNLRCLIAERLPDHGLGRTINERLTKAAGRTTPPRVKTFTSEI